MLFKYSHPHSPLSCLAKQSICEQTAPVLLHRFHLRRQQGRGGQGELQGKCQCAVSAHREQRCSPLASSASSASSGLGWGEAALPCQSRANKADWQDNPFPGGICGFISIFFFLQDEMKCEGVSAVKINCFVLS